MSTTHARRALYTHKYVCIRVCAVQLNGAPTAKRTPSSRKLMNQSWNLTSCTISMHDLLQCQICAQNLGIECTVENLCCAAGASRRCLDAVLVFALWAVSTLADDVDLPVATLGTEQWAGVVAKAMMVNGRSEAESLQALTSFQNFVQQRMGKTVSSPRTLTSFAVAVSEYSCPNVQGCMQDYHGASLTWPILEGPPNPKGFYCYRQPLSC